jgi:hypothetical protein
MKTKYPSMFGILAVLMLVVSFVLPTNLLSPSAAQADPGVCKWDTLREPGALTGAESIVCNDIIDMAVGSDFNTIVAIIKENAPPLITTNLVKISVFKGIFWSSTPFSALNRTSGWTAGNQVYQVAMAPDNPSFFVVTSDNGTLGNGPKEVWVTQNSGAAWNQTNLAILLGNTETIRSIDVSVDYGGTRDIAVGTVTGTGAGRLFVVKSSGFSSWRAQTITALGTGFDFFAVKFSPSYASDASLAVVFADNTTVSGACPAADGISQGATWYNIALRDLDRNDVLDWAIHSFPGVEVRDATWAVAASPNYLQINKAMLQLPSDFSGQAASLRRAYISLDAFVACDTAKPDCARDGIFRIDDTTPYTLMDTHSQNNKSIYSIAYFGTYASGKLLAGERMGFPCSAYVPTWFTDSPTTCPIPCWYPCLKCPTGAANQAGCTAAQCGIGAALVFWAPQGNLAYAATGSAAALTGATWFSHLWWINIPGVGSFGTPVVCRDESAVSVSRNNGETWNQISLIDTRISKFTDVAPTPDCKTIYLASVNNCDVTAIEPDLAACCGFDSVWRTSFNPDVVAPFTPNPVGTVWERVFTHVTAPDCTQLQTNYALLRVVPYCADPTGEIVAWAAYNGEHNAAAGINFANGHGVAAWSPDFGDYWAMLTPRNSVQDFCFESRTVMYFLSPTGLVQKMPYTGTAWSSALPSVDSLMALGAHTIAAYPEGKVLVGAASTMNFAVMATTFCNNFNTDNPSFASGLIAGGTGGGNVHVAFDPNYKDNSTIYIGSDSYAALQAGGCLFHGSVFRNNPTGLLRWSDTNMMDVLNGAVGCPEMNGQFGIVLAFTGSALYSASGPCFGGPCGVNRTIDDGTGKFGPLSGIPKPGVAWDFLWAGLPQYTGGAAVCFTLEPSSLKICGCCTLDTDSTLYAIDDANYVAGGAGRVWAFTDCLAKRGPALVTEDKTLIGCDPVSGRAQEVNLCWEQLCVANAYDIEIAKDTNFTIKIIDWVTEDSCDADDFLVPADVTAPCVFFPAGGEAIGITPVRGSGVATGAASAIAAFGNLECGHTYYWRVKARECATTQVIRSPWSEVRSFTVKAGLPVVSPYLGLQLLAPNNGCLGCPVSPVSFSWSPFKETTSYKFVLAKDAAMTQIVKEDTVSTTAYEYAGTLDYSTNYFWRVQSLEPAPSDWSATFSFQTEAQPAPAPSTAGPAPTPIWVWAVIAIGALLVIVVLVLIFKTRRV